MEESGKVFSDYDVSKTSSRTWFKGVKLIDTAAPTTIDPTPPAVPEASLANRVFKIMLLNNDQYFYKSGGYEF